MVYGALDLVCANIEDEYLQLASLLTYYNSLFSNYSHLLSMWFQTVVAEKLDVAT